MPSSHDSPNPELLHPRRSPPSGRRARPPGGWRLLRALLGLALVFSVLGLAACNKIFGEFHVDTDSASDAPCGVGMHRCLEAELWAVRCCESGLEGRESLPVGGPLQRQPRRMPDLRTGRRAVQRRSGAKSAQRTGPAGTTSNNACRSMCAEDLRLSAPRDVRHARRGRISVRSGIRRPGSAIQRAREVCGQALGRARHLRERRLVRRSRQTVDGASRKASTANAKNLSAPRRASSAVREPPCSAALNSWTCGIQWARAPRQRRASTSRPRPTPLVAAALTGCIAPCGPPLSYRCEGQQAFQCNETQSGEDPIEPPCPEGESCDVETGGCRKCTTGELRCNVATLETCDSNYEWVIVEQCATPALCSVSHRHGYRGNAGRVFGAGLRPHRFACDEAILMGCNTDQTQMIAGGNLRLEPALQRHRRSLRTPAVRDGRGCSSAPLRIPCAAASMVAPAGRPSSSARRAASATPTQSLGGNCLTECPDPPLQCVGNVRRVCSDSTGVALWTVDRTCSTPELCQCVLDGTCAERRRTANAGNRSAAGACPTSTARSHAPGVHSGARWLVHPAELRLCRPVPVDGDGDGGACLACPLAGEVQCYNGNRPVTHAATISANGSTHRTAAMAASTTAPTTPARSVVAGRASLWQRRRPQRLRERSADPRR